MPDGTKDCELLASGWRRAMCKAQANSNCDVRGTRHSGSVAHTAEND